MRINTRAFVLDYECDSEELYEMLIKHFKVITANSEDECTMLALSQNIDAIVINLDTIDKNMCMDMLEKYRNIIKKPIVIVSSADAISDTYIVHAYRKGIADFIKRPVKHGELDIRTRRAIGDRVSDHSSDVYKYDGFVMDFKRRKVYVNGVSIHITNCEYRMLGFLAKHAGEVKTYEDIIEAVWGTETANCYYDDLTVRVHITNIRKKIEPDRKNPRYLLTEKTIGYWMPEPEE